MSETSLKPIIEKLESLFSKFNEKFYNGELQTPIITVSPDTTKGEGFFEINICAEHLSRSFIEVAETLLHEMVHLYNLQIDVKDTSRSGKYHNKNFKDAAEKHGLIVKKDSKYGWAITELDNEAKDFVNGIEGKKFELHRRSIPKLPGAAKSKQSTRKYVCPECGLIIRATKEVCVICADCQQYFREEA